MILWTIQDYLAYEKLMDTGILTANEDYVLEKEIFAHAYDWLYKQMVRRVGLAPLDVKYPIWAWYQWEGKRKQPDMRHRGFSSPGSKIIRLTIDVNPSAVLLSDFDLWHYALNYWYLAIDEDEDINFEKKYEALGFSTQDILNKDINSADMQELRKIIENSWNRILDLNLEASDWVLGSSTHRSIQATSWYVNRSQIIKAEEFKAK